MAKRLSPAANQITYDFIVQRDGPKCRNCLLPPPQFEGRSKRGEIVVTYGRHDIDHKNNDAGDWRPDNLQLLCRSCNVSKQRAWETYLSVPEPLRPPFEEWFHTDTGASRNSPRVCAQDDLFRPSESPTERVRRIVGHHDEAGPVFHVSVLCEARFRAWMFDALSERILMLKVEAVNGGAEHAGCSPETARRYLAKMCSIAGPLTTIRNQYGRLLVTLRGASASLDPDQVNALTEVLD